MYKYVDYRYGKYIFADHKDNYLEVYILTDEGIEKLEGLVEIVFNKINKILYPLCLVLSIFVSLIFWDNQIIDEKLLNLMGIIIALYIPIFITLLAITNPIRKEIFFTQKMKLFTNQDLLRDSFNILLKDTEVDVEVINRDDPAINLGIIIPNYSNEIEGMKHIIKTISGNFYEPEWIERLRIDNFEGGSNLAIPVFQTKSNKIYSFPHIKGNSKMHIATKYGQLNTVTELFTEMDSILQKFPFSKIPRYDLRIDLGAILYYYSPKPNRRVMIRYISKTEIYVTASGKKSIRERFKGIFY